MTESTLYTDYTCKIEDAKHVILDCPLCADLRESLFYEVKRSNGDFSILSDDDKFINLFKSTALVWLTRPDEIF